MSRVGRMSRDIVMNHAAVECHDQDSADLFFLRILGMQKKKSSLLSKELSQVIFRIDKSVLFLSYENKATRIEVFIAEPKPQPSYRHLCIEVEKKDDFIARCDQYGLKPFFVEKEGKQLLFVRDFSQNLFEILEKH